MSVRWADDDYRPVDWRYWLAAALCAVPVAALLWVLMQTAIRVAVAIGGAA